MPLLRSCLVIYRENGKEKYMGFRSLEEAKIFRNKKGGKIEIFNYNIKLENNIRKDVGYGD